MDPSFAIPVILFALEAYVVATSWDSVTSAGRTIMLAALAAYGAVLGVSIAKSGKNRP